jgi:hypothetical protein
MERKFIEFFTGLDRNFGYCDLSNAKVNPDTGKLEIPIKDYGWKGRPVEDEDYKKHLEGSISIGIQPCNDDGEVIFGAIDVDVYKNFDIPKLLKTIQDLDIPIIPVKSKSGGFHLYVHFAHYVSASFARQFLKNLLYTLKLDPKTEIYPKQTNVEGRSGNFINIPYFGKKERVAINPQTGEEFTFEQYIHVVEANRKTEKELKEFVNSLTSSELSGGPEEFKDGPPCLQQLSKDKLEDGRDRFLYNYMVFAKKKYPDDWEEKVRYASREYFKNDGKWDDKKVEQKIKSWNQTESGYTCQDGVITAKCMEDVCYKRKYGKATDNVVEWPTFSSLTKINFDEPEFELTVLHRDRSGDEKSEQMSFKKGDAFLVQTDFRKQVATQLGIFLPKIKDKDYSLIMKVLFDGIESQKPPAGTTNKEKLFRYIKEYIHQVPATSHASFASGATFLKDDKAYFVYEKFHDFLRRKDWRIDDSKTGSCMKKWFKAEFGKRPRYPKTETQKQSNPQVECVAVPVELFKKEEAPDELITMLDKEDIL